MPVPRCGPRSISGKSCDEDTLLTLPAKPLLLLGLLGAGLGGVALWNGHERALGALGATIAARDAQLDSLRHRAARVDTVYRGDTAAFHALAGRYAVLLARWRAGQVTPSSTTNASDTSNTLVVGPPGTPPVPPLLVDPGQVIAVADSTIAACSHVVLTCAARVAARDSIIATQDTVISLLKKKANGTWWSRHVGCVAGGVASRQGVELGVGCGLKP
jgi:hypothetical protein